MNEVGALRNTFPKDTPLVSVRRGGLAESIHRGSAAVCDPAGELLDSFGDPESHVFLRSSAKPFQALPLVLSGAVDTFRLSDNELAVICASHNGEGGHLSAVRTVLRKAGLGEESLQSGAHPPLYGPAAERLVRNGEEPRPVHGNCSGKHAGMLALCFHEGWDLAGYRSPDHPAQRKVLAAISQVCGVKREEITVAGDNCGVPTFALPLEGLATGFARLATGERLHEELSKAAIRIRDAMRGNPYMVAGTGRFDTELMERTQLVAKSGAEAVFACGSSDGWGLALKISDGSGRAVRAAATATLARRGVELPEEMRSFETKNLHGEPVGGFVSLV